DGLLVSNVATVSLNVTFVNQPPTANNDAYSTPEESPLIVAAPGVLGNDTDPEGNPLTAVLVTGPTHGGLTRNADGSFTYTPDALSAGPDTSTYRASAASASAKVARLNLTAPPANHGPPPNATPSPPAENPPRTGPAPAVLATTPTPTATR